MKETATIRRHVWWQYAIDDYINLHSLADDKWGGGIDMHVVEYHGISGFIAEQVWAEKNELA